MQNLQIFHNFHNLQNFQKLHDLHCHRLHDLVVRNDHIQSITHQELMKTSPETMERMVNLYCTSQTTKVKIQETDMDKVCNASRELFASKSKEIFDEFHTLKRNLAYRFAEVFEIIDGKCHYLQGAIHKLASSTVHSICYFPGQQGERPSQPDQILWHI